MGRMSRIAGLAVGLAMMASAASAADTGCDGIDITFFTGGPEGDPFATIVQNGAKLAAAQTGCQVDYVWSERNPAAMVAQFKEAIARQPDGISIVGSPGEAALGPLINEARAAGIIVTTANASLPVYEDKYRAQGFGYVGPGAYAAGTTLGASAAEAAGLRHGDKAFVWGVLGRDKRGERTRGVIDALAARGIEVEYLEISEDVDKDPEQGAPVFASMMASRPGIKLVVIDHGALTAALGGFMRAAGLAPDALYGAGFDFSAATAEAIRGGDVDMVLDQQPFLQGYLPIIQIYLTRKFGFAGLNIDTGVALVTRDNVELVAPLAAEAIR